MKPRFRIEYNRRGRGNWATTFWIDQQGFTIVTGRPEKQARWFGRRLRTAFSKLQFKDEKIS